MKVNEKIKLSLSSLFLLCIFLMHAGFINAQDFDIKGTVKNDTGESIPGVSVVIKNSSQGTFTSETGEYTIKAKTGDVLQYIFIGYITEERTVGTAGVIDVIMNENIETLGDVIVVGYGVQKKSVVTAAISKVTADNLELAKPTRIEDVLKGKVAGVQITQNSGQPGSGSHVRIR